MRYLKAIISQLIANRLKQGETPAVKYRPYSQIK